MYNKAVLFGVDTPPAQSDCFADEIATKFCMMTRYIIMCGISADLLTVTFNGLSKAYRVAGFRQGWMILDKKGGKRLSSESWICWHPCVCVPTIQCNTYQTTLGGYQSINEFILPGRALARTT